MATAEIDKLLQAALTQVYELEQTLADFRGEASQALLNERLQEFMGGVQQLRTAAAKVKHIEVPVDLLRWVDDGGHPDDFVKKTFTDAMRGNQLSKGKVDAIQQLRDQLLAEAQQALPQQTAAYEAASIAAGAGAGTAARSGAAASHLASR